LFIDFFVKKKKKLLPIRLFNMDPIESTTTTTPGLTIIRLKRKQNEEPLDALGI
jgi:hypothetical protein